MNNNVGTTTKNLVKVKIDFILLIPTMLLIAAGLLFIYSAEHTSLHSMNFNFDNFSLFIKQLIFLIPALAALVVGWIWDYQRMAKYTWYFYAGILVLLILVLLVGKKVHGSKAWLNIIPGFGIQPSEFAKPILILTLAYFMDRNYKEMHTLRSFMLALLIAAPFIGLIFLQPDFGMIIVYLPIILTMLYLGGVKLRDILILIFSGLLSILFGVLGLGNKLAELFLQISNENVTAEGAIKLENLATGLSYVGSWFGDYLVILPFAGLMLAFALINYFIWRRNKVRFFEIVMAICLTIVIGIMGSIAFRSVIYDYHLSRMVATVAQSMDIGYVNQDIGYQTDRSIKAIGAGGAYGAGYLAGRQKEGEFVPERTTDFIFTVIGEETGFKGTLLLFFLYFIIGARGLYISYITRNRMGSLVAGGLTIMITFQAAINLASCTGIFPVAGLPLPFLSAGGSSLITLMFSVGLLMNVNSHRFYH